MPLKHYLGSDVTPELLAKLRDPWPKCWSRSAPDFWRVTDAVCCFTGASFQKACLRFTTVIQFSLCGLAAFCPLLFPHDMRQSKEVLKTILSSKEKWCILRQLNHTHAIEPIFVFRVFRSVVMHFICASKHLTSIKCWAKCTFCMCVHMVIFHKLRTYKVCYGVKQQQQFFRWTDKQRSAAKRQLFQTFTKL